MAAGSADEVRTTQRVAVARGDLEEADLAEALRLLDQVLAMAWRLTHEVAAGLGKPAAAGVILVENAIRGIAGPRQRTGPG